MRVINLFLMLLLIKTVALAQQKSNIQPSETNMSIELDEKEFRAVKAYLNEATKKTVVKPKFSEFLKKTLGNSYAETINKVKGKTPLKNGEISTDGCVLVVQKGGLYINNDTKQETSLKNDDKGGVKEKVSFTKDKDGAHNSSYTLCSGRRNFLEINFQFNMSLLCQYPH